MYIARSKSFRGESYPIIFRVIFLFFNLNMLIRLARLNG